MEMLVTITLTLLLTSPASSHLLEDVRLKVVGTLKDIITSAEEILIALMSGQCSVMKRLLGDEYDQMQNRDNSPDISGLSLNFITRHCYETYNLSTAAEEIAKSNWLDPNHGLIIYVHGYLSNANESGYRNIDNAFLSRGPYNIVALDASSVLGLLYLRATTYVVYIGEILGKVMANMHKLGLKPGSVYLICHSLGAHICSFAGKTFRKLTGHKVGRISGLDPAGPCFTTVDVSLKLKSSDADFVDVIHTNAKIFGLNENIGHVDFYPNGGSSQPGCILPTCNHSFVWRLFAESVLFPNNFVAVACTSWSDFKKRKCNYTNTSLMGYGCSSTVRGRYYLQTAGSIPYGLGKFGTKYYD